MLVSGLQHSDSLLLLLLLSCRLYCIIGYYKILGITPCAVQQGSPTPGPWSGSGPWSVRNRAAQQEVSGGQASEASSAAPHRSPSLALLPEPLLALLPEPSPHPIHGKIVFHETHPCCQKGWGLLLYSKSLLLIYFMYSSFYLLIPY